jgi:predicted nuclease of predicted toxin-antitoxin system
MLLLDENTSPRIVNLLWKRQVDAVHIRDRNLLGAADHEIWRFAQQEARTIVTINGRDFRRLAKSSPEHRGIVVIPSGGSPDAQLDLIMSAVTWITSTNSSTGSRTDIWRSARAEKSSLPNSSMTKHRSPDERSEIRG